MGSLYRSEEMCLAQLFLQSEAAYACVAELGELGLVQFRDLNPDVNAFQRKFVNEVRRCDEMERRLRFFEKEVTTSGISILNTGENPNAPAPREMIDLEACFEKLENELKEVNTNQEALMRNFLELTELKHILKNTQTFFQEGNRPEEGFGFSDMQLGFVTGVIRRERIPAFEQMLWRVCRGNVFLRQAEIQESLKDPSTGEEVWKSVFIIFFQGDQLKIRVKKICEGFRATLYPCNETAAERNETSIAVLTRLEDLQKVLSQTEEHRQRLLTLAAKSLRVWLIKVRKLKAIYHTLNLFNLDVTQKCLIAECWCPVTDLDSIKLALRRGTEASGSSVPSILNRIDTDEEPPTYNKTNRFTKVFQSLVDAYGVANYREVNPAPFTFITYPFLFAVMYGDCGHGFLLFLFGLWLVVREKQLYAALANHEMFGMLYSGRYVIMMMGIFSVYTGLIYNDCLSKSIKIFSSTWNVSNMNYSDALLNQDTSLQINPVYTQTGVYPFGIDPMWQLAANQINFLNSYKMKLSVILGISQMTFGVVLSLFNHRYFKKRLNVWCEFVPQMIFMVSIFGYLVILIFVKWLVYNASNSGDAPSLILTLINMGLFVAPAPPMFAGQAQLQIFLVLVAISCIPWMLAIKPAIIYFQRKNRYMVMRHDPGAADSSGLMTSDTTAVINQDELAINNSDPEEPELPRQEEMAVAEEELDIGELCVYQAIHTIEYCLGCISHTASYLRLWALSLAHAELSEVLWSMVLAIGTRLEGYLGVVGIFVTWGAWAILTMGILLFMESLSAFLHTLRLHWIEFQSKFYHGEGHPFMPFAFQAILEGKEE
ncbi:V-type proton ATPase 116 kDa subunit a 1-like [Diadema antillarum]|uniref:V-type proton ATPase 116 kDa subunit a 1-like n=1 Tax=Diadema antillarum TaxID=105358 RepID=UPI003A84E315